MDKTHYMLMVVAGFFAGASIIIYYYSLHTEKLLKRVMAKWGESLALLGEAQKLIDEMQDYISQTAIKKLVNKKGRSNEKTQ
jgi:hypothetical protein